MIDLRTFNSDADAKAVDRFFVFLNGGLLTIHIVLQFVYQYIHASFMVNLNIVSIFVYMGMIFVLRKKNYPHFVLVVYGEVYVHSILATLILGWPAGFQLWLLALSCAYFFPTLVFERFMDTHKLSWVFAGISAVTYMILLFLSRYISEASYFLYLSADNYFSLQVLNSAIAFAVVMFFSSTFAKGLIGTNKMLSKYANFDELTGLYNRYGFKTLLNSGEFVRANELYTAAILDIDNFKTINDTYGHGAGDVALKTIGAILLDNIDDESLICRWGGDEFTFVRKGEFSEVELYERIEAFRKAIEGTILEYNDQSFHITISCGIARKKEGEDLNRTFYRADRALYDAKAQGKNCVCIDK